MTKTKIKWVDCHRLPERSFFYKGKQFPVCARCTGVYVGMISIIIFLFIDPLSWWISIFLLIPTIVDGGTQAYCNRESNNTLRFITGLLFGIGLSSLGTILGLAIGRFLKSILL